MKNKLELTGYIKHGDLSYEKSYDTMNFFNQHEGSDIAITVKLGGDSVAFWQHKYYRGFLLPEIADKSYDDNINLAHFSMKRMFLLEQVESVRDVPNDYMERAMLICDTNGNVIAYIPSTGDLTSREMKNFILAVEGLVLEYLSGINADGKKARDNAFKV